MCIKDYPWNPNATHTVIKIRMTSDNGIRYFHSNFRIWSIRRRGKVQRTHIRSHTTAKVLPKNQMKPGIKFIKLSKPSTPMFNGAQPPRNTVEAIPEITKRFKYSAK